MEIDIDEDLKEELEEFEGSFERNEVVYLWRFKKKNGSLKNVGKKICSLKN